MKIDKNTLEEIINESLAELQEQEGETQQVTDKEMQDFHGALDSERETSVSQIVELEKQIELLKAENEALKEKMEQMRDQSSAPPSDAVATMQESFQITKGRLRQIISEEMKNAKQQGIV